MKRLIDILVVSLVPISGVLLWLLYQTNSVWLQYVSSAYWNAVVTGALWYVVIQLKSNIIVKTACGSIFLLSVIAFIATLFEINKLHPEDENVMTLPYACILGICIALESGVIVYHMIRKKKNE